MPHPIDFRDNRLFGYAPGPLEEAPGFRYLGQLKTKPSKEITDSIVGIGFETLDRDTFDPEEVYDFLGASGIKHARVQTGWMKCETTPGVYCFKWLDAIVDNLLSRGLKPWLSLSYGNPLYTPNPEYDRFVKEQPGVQPPGWLRGFCGEVPYYHGERAMTAWLAYVEATVRHFQGRVSEYEIWNEPDMFGIFWNRNGKIPYPELSRPERCKRGAADYADFARRTATVIKAAFPEAKTVCAPGYMHGDYEFALAENRISEIVDVIACHTYGSERQSHDARRYAQVQAILQPKELWMGESGSPSRCAPSMPYMFGANEFSQAKFVVRRLCVDAAFGMKRSSIYTACDFKNYWRDGSDSACGVVNRLEKRPKLAFYAIQSIATLFEGLQKCEEFGLYPLTPSNQRMCSVLKYNTPLCGAFRKNGAPFYSVFNPEQTMICADVLNVYLVCAQGSERFQEPVVVDPLRQAVYAATVEYPNDASGAAAIKNFPVADYPLFITDRRAVEIVAPGE